MPFLKGGRYAVTRSKKYLDAGRIVFKENVKILAVNTCSKGVISDGTREFIRWHLPPLQFKNPSVQVRISLEFAFLGRYFSRYLSDPFPQILSVRWQRNDR